MNLRRVLQEPAWSAFRGVSRLSLALKRGRYRYIFILGHMRSGSTLLSHILASHPAVVGAGECNIRYNIPADLAKLVLRTCEWLHRPVLRETYVVDQINHDFVTDEVLRSEAISRCVILLREPEATLQSIMMSPFWSGSEREALDYYVDRLKRLTHYATVLRERAALIEYDDLVDKAELTLSALTEFLGLSSPLAPNYELHRMTARTGDSSPNIKVGKIIRTPKRHINISSDIIAAAADCHGKCRAKIRTTLVTTACPRANVEVDRGPARGTVVTQAIAAYPASDGCGCDGRVAEHDEPRPHGL